MAEAAFRAAEEADAEASADPAPDADQFLDQVDAASSVVVPKLQVGAAAKIKLPPLPSLLALDVAAVTASSRPSNASGQKTVMPSAATLLKASRNTGTVGGEVRCATFTTFASSLRQIQFLPVVFSTLFPS